MAEKIKAGPQGFNEGVAPNNSLHYALSLAAAPLATVFVALGFSPFTITSISNVIVLISLYVLWQFDLPVVFALLWVGALLLDFSDGIVARRTGTSSANGSFYDHFADKVKVAALFLVVGLKYGTTEMWVVAWAASSFFFLMSVVNGELGYRSYRLEQGLKAAASASASGASAAGVSDSPTLARRVKNLVKGLVPQNPVLRGLYYSLTMVQGNSMVLLVPVAFGEVPALIATAWFAFLCLKSLFFISRAQITINRRLAAAKISWK